MCPYTITVAHQKKKAMSRELFRKILADLAGWESTAGMSRALVLTLQNEPFLDGRLELFIDEARKALPNNWEIEITSNGTLIDGERFESLLISPPDLLNVSINASQESTYADISPGFELRTVQDNVERIAKHGELGLMLRFIKQKSNMGEYRQFRKKWHGIPTFSYPANNRAGSIDRYNSNSIQFSSPIKRFLRIAAKIVYPACPLLFAQANITADGKVLLCCNDFENAAIMGDLNTSSLLEVFNSPRYRAVRENALKGTYEGICKQCSIYREWLD